MRLKITATLAELGQDVLRYDFVISPLVPDSGVFRFMRYCCKEDIEKGGERQIRRLIADSIRTRHKSTWERYHRWADEL